MLDEDRALLCEIVGTLSKLLEDPSECRGRPCECLRKPCARRGMPCPFRGTLWPFLGMLRIFQTMLCVFVGHRRAGAATPFPFSGHRDAFAAIPSALRDAHLRSFSKRRIRLRRRARVESFAA